MPHASVDAYRRPHRSISSAVGLRGASAGSAGGSSTAASITGGGGVGAPEPVATADPVATAVPDAVPDAPPASFFFLLHATSAAMASTTRARRFMAPSLLRFAGEVRLQ